MFSPDEITEVSKLDGVRAKIEDFQPDHIDQTIGLPIVSLSKQIKTSWSIDCLTVCRFPEPMTVRCLLCLALFPIGKDVTSAG